MRCAGLPPSPLSGDQGRCGSNGHEIFFRVIMYAIVKTGGKQYRVAAEDVLKIDKVKGEPGEIVEFGEVLVVGGDNVTLIDVKFHQSMKPEGVTTFSSGGKRKILLVDDRGGYAVVKARNW